MAKYGGWPRDLRTWSALPFLLLVLTLNTAVGQTATGATSTQASPATKGGVSTAAPTGGPSWSSLSPSQQQILAPLAKDWTSIDPAGKTKWLDLSARFPKMPADEQQRVQLRMAEWARLSPAERGRARLTFLESKQLSPQLKQDRWEQYNSLPPDSKQALAERNRRQALDNKPRPMALPSAPPSLESAQPKTTQAPAPSASSARLKPVSPTVVQGKPGATTMLMTERPKPPAHQQPGEPKIAVKPGQVDRETLLPKSGPQAAASAPRLP